MIMKKLIYLSLLLITAVMSSCGNDDSQVVITDISLIGASFRNEYITVKFVNDSVAEFYPNSDPTRKGTGRCADVFFNIAVMDSTATEEQKNQSVDVPVMHYFFVKINVDNHDKVTLSGAYCFQIDNKIYESEDSEFTLVEDKNSKSR